MVAQLEDAGLSFVGKDESGQRMEVDMTVLAIGPCDVELVCKFDTSGDVNYILVCGPADC